MDESESDEEQESGEYEMSSLGSDNCRGTRGGNVLSLTDLSFTRRLEDNELQFDDEDDDEELRMENAKKDMKLTRMRMHSLKVISSA